MGSLRKLFDLFEQKTQLMRLLDVSQPRRGRAHLHRRRERGRARTRSCRSCRRPTRSTAEVVGTLGVIGPTRMAYDRMIQIVDITSRLVSNALSTK